MGKFRMVLAGLLGALTMMAQTPAPAPEMDGVPASSSEQTPSAQTTPTRPIAIEYSDGYFVRRKIHKYASIATIPLFVAEFAVGQKLYNNTTNSGSLRGVHSGLAAGVATLFGVNSVTGVWNLLEARKDPSHKRRRTIHGILMLAADAGFVATAALAPENEHRLATTVNNRRSTHRAVALSSMGVAAASYIFMLIAR